MNVDLTYFNDETGAFFSRGSYHTSFVALDDIVDEVRRKLNNGSLPGLITAHAKNLIVYVNVPGHPKGRPALIVRR